MYFVGLDLAWSDKNFSGLTVLKYDKITKKYFIYDIKIIKTNEEILDYIYNLQKKQKEIIIGLDAPVIINNLTGQRLCEKELNKEFKNYQALTYPTNLTILKKYSGNNRVILLTENLFKNNFISQPLNTISHRTFNAENPLKAIYEVFPHSACINFFNLETIYKYKAKPKREIKLRQEELKKLYLSIKKTFNINLQVLGEIDFTELKGKKFKELEDKLDSILCSLIVFNYWLEPKQTKIYGDYNNGFIINPIKNIIS